MILHLFKILMLYDTDINDFIATILMLYDTDIIGIIAMILMLYDTDIIGIIAMILMLYDIQISLGSRYHDTDAVRYRYLIQHEYLMMIQIL